MRAARALKWREGEMEFQTREAGRRQTLPALGINVLEDKDFYQLLHDLPQINGAAQSNARHRAGAQIIFAELIKGELIKVFHKSVTEG